jgi:hypothetical protein
MEAQGLEQLAADAAIKAEEELESQENAATENKAMEAQGLEQLAADAAIKAEEELESQENAAGTDEKSQDELKSEETILQEDSQINPSGADEKIAPQKITQSASLINFFLSKEKEED